MMHILEFDILVLRRYSAATDSKEASGGKITQFFPKLNQASYINYTK